MNIDDRDRGRKGIEEMLVRMSKMTDMPDNPKKKQNTNIKHRQGKIRTLQTERSLTLYSYL